MWPCWLTGGWNATCSAPPKCAQTSLPPVKPRRKLASSPSCPLAWWSVGPAEEHAAGGVTGADGDQQHQITLAQAPLGDGVAQPERDGGGGGVAVAVDIDKDLGIVHTEPVLHGADDAKIGLVGHDQGEVAARIAVALALVVPHQAN